MYLYLSSVSCCDVGYGPAGFLPDGFLCTAEQVKEAWQSRAVQYHLEQTGEGEEEGETKRESQTNTISI